MIGDFDVSMSSQTVEFKPRNPHEAEAFFRPDRINGLMSDLTEVAAMAYGSGIGEGPSGGVARRLWRRRWTGCSRG